ncbi:MAG: HD domain-containing protein [Armatimonadetes bacterium]|nr:HD domain-containing protein [Armatimonadota bacterium]
MPSQEFLGQLARAFADRQLFLVGGSIRDELLARETSDLDFATDVPPEKTRRRVEPWADSVWLVGEKFGTVGLQYGQTKAEITTFRTDTYDGVSRKPEVEFGDSIEEDLARRDFTINAMARNVHTGELLDPFGGQQDLAAHLIRFVGDAESRIREDPLRMLRAVRFVAQLGFELDPTAAAAIASEASQLARISWERIRDELDAVLISAQPADGLRLMIDLGLAEHILPEVLRLHLPEPHRHHMRDLLEHTLDTVTRVPATKLLRYAALLHDVAKPETLTSDETGVHFYRHERIGAEQAAAILTRLRQSGDLVHGVGRLVREHMRIPYYRSEWTDAALRRLMYDLGEFLEPALQLAEADVRASDPVDLPGFEAQMAELRQRLAGLGDASEIARTKPLLNGEEIMALLGIEAGPKVGEVLDALLEEQIEGRVTNRDEALAYVKKRF